MAEMKISNTLVNDTSTGEIAYVEQLKDRLLKNYINTLETKDKNRIPADIKAEAGVFQERLNEFFIKHWVDFQAFLLDEGVDPTVIDSWAEVQEFLEGLPDDEAMWLKTKLQQLDNRITAMDIPDGGAYDVSADHVDGGGVYARYASLSAAIAAIASEDRKPGMTIRFINSNTGTYEQWRYTGTAIEGSPNPFVDTSNWQGTDNAVTEDSTNLVESGAVFDAIDNVAFSTNEKINTIGVDSTPTEASQNLVMSGGVATKINEASLISDNPIVNSIFREAYFLFDLSTHPSLRFYKSGSTRRLVFGQPIGDIQLVINNDGTFIGLDYATLSNLKCFGVLDLDKFDENASTVYHSVIFKNWCEIPSSSPSGVLQTLMKPSDIKSISYTKTTGKRINTAGNVVDAGNSWFYTSPVSVKKGDVISLRDVVGNNSVAIASYVITEDTKYENVSNLKYSGVDGSNYTFVVEKNGNIAFSLNNGGGHYPAIYSISSETISSIIDLIKIAGVGTPVVDNSQANQVGVASVEVTKNADVLTFKFKNLKGETGATGANGQNGAQGPQGNSGYQGAAGELEVVNNLTDGGATSALSAEQGVILKRLADLANNINNAPVVPKTVIKELLSKTSDAPSSWTASNNGTVESNKVEIFDEVNNEVLSCIKFNCYPLASGSSYSEFKASLSSAVNIKTTAMCGSIYLDPTIADADRGSILIKLYSGNSNSNSATIYLWYLVNSEAGRTLYSRNYWYHFAINAYAAINNKTSGFDETNVTDVSIVYQNGYGTSPYIATTGISFVEQLHKPAISLVVDNYNPSVPYMADYAASKGIKLTTTIVPSYIGGAGSANLDRINDGKLQGNLIGNHTWSHQSSLGTEKAYIEEIQKAENYMLNNGFIRGCKFVSVPSATFNNLKYLAYCKTNAQMIYHNWIKGPQALVDYPYYPCQREHNITIVDNNPSTPEAAAAVVASMKNNIQEAILYNGLVVFGFHGTFWEADNGVAWKDLIDHIASLSGVSVVTADDLIEGLIC